MDIFLYEISIAGQLSKLLCFIFYFTHTYYKSK